MNSLKEDCKWTEKEIKQLQKKKEQTETALQEVNKKIEEQPGPFSSSIKQEIDSMKLERAKYHKGTLMGNDVYELLQPKSIKAISMCLKPKIMNIGFT